MPFTAGQTPTADELNAVTERRIATTADTSDSSSFTTTETLVSTVTAALVSGRTYRITFQSLIRSTAADDRIGVNIREDNVTGTTLMVSDWKIHNNTTTGSPIRLEAEYTASSTGNKTFIVGVGRSNGTGTITARGAASAPRYLYVDYVRN